MFFKSKYIVTQAHLGHLGMPGVPSSTNLGGTNYSPTNPGYGVAPASTGTNLGSTSLIGACTYPRGSITPSSRNQTSPGCTGGGDVSNPLQSRNMIDSTATRTAGADSTRMHKHTLACMNNAQTSVSFRVSNPQQRPWEYLGAPNPVANAIQEVGL
jgi:hypothetical protein